MSSFFTLRDGLAVRTADGDFVGDSDLNQSIDALGATRDVFGHILGGPGIYAGGATVLADLTGGHTAYPPVTIAVLDSAGNLWPFRTTAATPITFTATSGSCKLWAVPALIAGASPAAATGATAGLTFVCLATGATGPANGTLLGTGSVTASAFTSWTPEDLAPGAPLVDVGAAGALLAANDLHDLHSASTARTNLGLGTAATHDTGDFLPSTLGPLVYQGSWNANTNSPTLASGVGTKGYAYRVSVAGTTNLDGNASWLVGDTAVFDGTVWDHFADDLPAHASTHHTGGSDALTAASIGGAPATTTTSALKGDGSGGTAAAGIDDLSDVTVSLVTSAEAWQARTALPSARYLSGVCEYNGFHYVLGGQITGGTGYTTETRYAALAGDGSLGSWTSGTALPAEASQCGAYAKSGFLFRIGGNGSGGVLSNAVRAVLAGDGSFGTWTDLGAISGFSSRAAIGWAIGPVCLYAVGGSGSSAVDIFTADGSGNLTHTAGAYSLPWSISCPAVAVVNGYLVVATGYASGLTAKVYTAPVHPTTGQLTGPFVDQTGTPYPLSLSYAPGGSQGGKMYVMGGETSWGSGAATDACYAAVVNGDGTLGAWTAHTNLTAATAYQSSLSSSNGNLYTYGGYSGAAKTAAVSELALGVSVVPGKRLAAWPTDGAGADNSLVYSAVGGAGHENTVVQRDGSGLISGVVPTSTTVNGHALSGNVTVTAADLGLGVSDSPTVSGITLQPPAGGTGLASYNQFTFAAIPYYNSHYSLGTSGSPSDITTTTGALWEHFCYVRKGSADVLVGEIGFWANGTHGSTYVPTQFGIKVMPTAGTSTTLAMLITADLKTRLYGALQVDGNGTLGAASTNTFTFTGRCVLRTLSADPLAGGGVAGTRGEVAVYNDALYLKTVDTGTNTNWLKQT